MPNHSTVLTGQTEPGRAAACRKGSVCESAVFMMPSLTQAANAFPHGKE
jgi:hypothetical protein